MAKSTSGGKRSATSGAAPTVTPTQVTPPTPQQVAAGNVLPGGGVAFSEFMQMTDDEKADVVTKALGVGLPVFLDDSGLQRFAYFTGMSDKPTLVSDSALDSMNGTEVFRTVYDAYNARTDIGYSSTDIIKQISEGDFTMYSDSGGSAHGKAIYFANTYRDSALYGSGQKNPRTMRAKITGTNIINERTLDSQYRAALSKGDKLALACSNADSRSARNLYGLAKGYSATYDSGGSGYWMILNRNCLTVSTTSKKTDYGRGKW